MTDRPLFQTPLPQLRDAFVAARFAQDDVFGRADIEQWLFKSTHRGDDPNNSTTEWGAGAFIKYLEMYCGHLGARTFADWIFTNATVQINPPDRFLSGVPYARALYATFQLGRTMLFSDWSSKHDAWPVLIIDNHAFVAEFKGPRTVLTPREAPIMTLREATILDVQRILLAEVMDNRPKRDRALTWLSNNYQQAIRNTRLLARADFNKAVAVSPDGTRIVKAEFVVVLGESCATVFEGSVFRTRKAKLTYIERQRIPQGTTRNDAESVAGLINGLYNDDRELYEMTRGSAADRAKLLDFQNGEVSFKVLIVHEDHVPSPLPDGGWEIRV